MFKILLVEDDRRFRKAIRDMLCEEFASLRVTEAGNGDEALEQVRIERPNLVVMDIRLPGKNGLDVMKQIKCVCPNVSVVILTSYDFPEYRDASLQYGAEQFLVKGTTKRDHILALVAARIAEEKETSRGCRIESKHDFRCFGKVSQGGCET